MKKIGVILVLLFIPFVIEATECDKQMHQEYLEYADNIRYDNSFSKASNSFTITIYNVLNQMYVVYNNHIYKPSSDNIVTISGIKEGTNSIIDVYASDNCSMIKQMYINEKYYNSLYGSSDCDGYEDILTICSSQFTSTKTTKELLEKVKNNYNKSRIKEAEKTEEVIEEVSILSKVKTFLYNWGIKIVILFLTTAISVSIYSNKYRKVKHGI